MKGGIKRKEQRNEEKEERKKVCPLVKGSTSTSNGPRRDFCFLIPHSRLTVPDGTVSPVTPNTSNNRHIAMFAFCHCGNQLTGGIITSQLTVSEHSVQGLRGVGSAPVW